MNEIPDLWQTLEQDNRVTIRVENDDYDAFMHPDLDQVKAFFPDDGEQTVFTGTREHDAPFNFEVAFHKEVITQPVDEYAEQIARELSEEFESRIEEVYEQFDSLADVLNHEA